MRATTPAKRRFQNVLGWLFAGGGFETTYGKLSRSGLPATGCRFISMLTRRSSHASPDLLTSICAGTVAGVLGTIAMSTAEAVWSMGARQVARTPVQRKVTARRVEHAGVGAGRYAQGEPRAHEQRISPTERIADRVVQAATGERPSPKTRAMLGSLSHYGFGAAMGAIYGALMSSDSKEMRKLVSTGQGTAYGTAVLVLADEIAMPAAGLAPPPHHTPPRSHVYALVAHLAFGYAMDRAYRGLLTLAAR